MRTLAHCRHACCSRSLPSPSPRSAQNVKVTSLGSHTGELCSRDRAMIFEDPTGVRILYDAGQSVTGADDPRLGVVHAVLLSHAHGDHIGDLKLKAQDAGACDNPELISAAPNSTTAEIAAAKNAAVIMSVPMANFIGKKIENIKAKPTANCLQSGGDLVVPFAAPCIAFVHIGGLSPVRMGSATKAVEITVVTAAHESSVPRSLLTDPEKKNLEADNLGVHARAVHRLRHQVHQRPHGLPVRRHRTARRNEEVVAEFYKANLMVLNLGPNAVTAAAGAYVANVLVQPATRDRDARQRGRDGGGKSKPGNAYRVVHGPSQGPAGVSGAVGQDDGVRRRRQMRDGLLIRILRGGCAALALTLVAGWSAPMAQAPAAGALANGQAAGTLTVKGKIIKLAYASVFVDQEDKAKPVFLLLTEQPVPAANWKSRGDMRMYRMDKNPLQGVVFRLDDKREMIGAEYYDGDFPTSTFGIFALKLDGPAGKTFIGTVKSTEAAAKLSEPVTLERELQCRAEVAEAPSRPTRRGPRSRRASPAWSHGKLHRPLLTTLENHALLVGHRVELTVGRPSALPMGIDPLTRVESHCRIGN